MVLTNKQGRSDVQLDQKWSSIKNSNIDHYHVYKTTEPLGESSSTSYSNSGLTPNTKYYHNESALYNAGKIAHFRIKKARQLRLRDKTAHFQSQRNSIDKMPLIGRANQGTTYMRE